ncbi:MAG: helix-turn-helix transcriptional regulator [Clostridia bacterium]|nr:helix-turn-helix transcriptional regulator [Clostridia bacterium]
MAITYRKLWKLLIDRKIKKGELQKLANISGSSIAKLGRNENVNTDILLKICQALNCNISEIMEIEKEEGDSNV